MFHALRAALEVVYSTSDIHAGLPYVATTAAVVCGGNILWYMIMAGFELAALRKERGTRWALSDRRDGQLEYTQKQTRNWHSAVHFFSQSIYYVGVAFIIWIGGAMSGVNPWTSAYTGLAVSIIAGAAFSVPLSMSGSGYCVTGSSAISIGEHIEVAGLGPDWSGRICGIYPMCVEIERYDEVNRCAEIITLPISMILTTPRKRNFHKELYGKRVLTAELPGAGGLRRRKKDYLV